MTDRFMHSNKILYLTFLIIILSFEIFPQDSALRDSLNNSAEINFADDSNQNEEIKFKFSEKQNSKIFSSENDDNSIYWINAKNKIYLNSNPPNAKVFLQDSLLGFTPIYLSMEIPQVKIEKENFKSILFNLSKSENEIINLEYTGPLKKESFLKTNLFKILLGSAVVLGGSAAYFKLKADDEFKKYEATNDTQYLNRTDNYDTISGISLGALQINFGVLVYYFLSD